MISVENGLRICEEILATGDIELLAVEGAEILNKHNQNIPLSTKETFIIGLAYSEFYATENNDSGYWRASIKRNNFCKKLGIDGFEFTQKVESLL